MKIYYKAIAIILIILCIVFYKYSYDRDDAKEITDYSIKRELAKVLDSEEKKRNIKIKLLMPDIYLEFKDAYVVSSYYSYDSVGVDKGKVMESFWFKKNFTLDTCIISSKVVK